jgi:hypothetical protein
VCILRTRQQTLLLLLLLLLLLDMLSVNFRSAGLPEGT